MEQQNNNNVSVQPNSNEAQNEVRVVKQKPLVQVTITATVKEMPTSTTIANKTFFKTYVELATDYRPFSTDIFTVAKPNVQIGDVVNLSLSTNLYKLHLQQSK